MQQAETTDQASGDPKINKMIVHFAFSRQRRFRLPHRNLLAHAGVEEQILLLCTLQRGT